MIALVEGKMDVNFLPTVGKKEFKVVDFSRSS
jgi:hypothetical protein